MASAASVQGGSERPLRLRADDVEDLQIVSALAQDAVQPSTGFADWAQGEGRRRHDALCREAEEIGVFGVPTFVYRDELFWGSERLGMLRERIEETLAA